MRRPQSGFTLIELLIVISIIGVLAAVLLPTILESRGAANAFADARQLARHNEWLELYKTKHKGGLPIEGGHKFVLATWTSKIFTHNEENLDFYFTPGSRDNDPDYRRVRQDMERGIDPWPDLASVTTLDTHYVGRAQKELRTATRDGNEALMANDNEGMWTFSDGTVNVLFNGGKVRTYSYQDLKERFGLGDLEPNNPIQTWGPNSPIPECQMLDN
jgi:prepilin-type N-terminal cleavage/methylation domain-containing protein